MSMIKLKDGEAVLNLEAATLLVRIQNPSPELNWSDFSQGFIQDF